MPQTKQAKKALRKSIKTAAFNKKMRADLDKIMKKTKKSLVNKSTDAAELIKLTIKKLDKAAQKKLLKKNKVSRTKSRLMRQFNKIK